MNIPEDRGRSGSFVKEFAIWLGFLILLTGGCLVWLHRIGLDVQTGSGAVLLVLSYSPALSALITAALSRGLRPLRVSLLRWRVGGKWYLFGIALPILLVVGADAYAASTTGVAVMRWYPANWAALAASFGSIFAGSFGEEVGWRGFAQPLLQRRLSVLWASLIVGAIWGTWHLNSELLSMSPTLPIIAAQTYVRMIATAILYGWLYDRTGRSLPVVMVAHAGHNIAVSLFASEPDLLAFGSALSALYALAAVPAAIALVRGRRPSSKRAQVESG